MKEVSWSVSVIEEETLPYLAGIKINEFYLNPESCVLAFHRGRSKLAEIFHESVSDPGVHCPHNSYGHVSSLGCKIVFPENSEPYAKPTFANLDEGISALERKVDFASNPLFAHHLKMYNHLRNVFKDEEIAFSGFGYEGPVTTAGLLRGQSFFTDIHREPEKAREFLKLVTTSVVTFVHFLREADGGEKVNPNSGGLCDDHASFIPPSMWPKFVLPYWDQYYNCITTGKRNLHCENLSPPHLKYLAQAGISHYEPSVSPRLNPQTIKELISIPFSWLLSPFKATSMTKEEVRGWVIEVAGSGVNHIWLEVDKFLCEGNGPDRVAAFIDTCKEIK